MLKIPEINQGNLHLLLPSKISWWAGMLVEYKGMNITEAIKTIYDSKLYKKLKVEAQKCGILVLSLYVKN